MSARSVPDNGLCSLYVLPQHTHFPNEETESLQGCKFHQGHTAVQPSDWYPEGLSVNSHSQYRTTCTESSFADRESEDWTSRLTPARILRFCERQERIP